LLAVLIGLFLARSKRHEPRSAGDTGLAIYRTVVKMDPRHRRPPLVATRADDPKLSAKKGRIVKA
jgi:hypothetical protein